MWQAIHPDFTLAISQYTRQATHYHSAIISIQATGPNIDPSELKDIHDELLNNNEELKNGLHHVGINDR